MPDKSMFKKLMQRVETKLAIKNSISVKVKITYKIIASLLFCVACLTYEDNSIVFIASIVGLIGVWIYLQILYYLSTDKD
ncbi:hypothetical protein AN394_01713 [Pseudoalteromonas sp. P1-26]|nr:hypothetical protein AN213_02837 [Pseudoalteromonas sp. P1-8]KPZ72763.1 hypothetical protein AN394_01713 [Pseudoalteromonas sp. P1-26]